MSRICRALPIAVLALGLAAPCALSAPSSSATISFTAEVDFVDDFAGGLCFAPAPGDKITGTYTYDVKTPDSNPEDWVADYNHTEPAHGITVDLGGGVVTQTNPALTPGDTIDYAIELVDDAPFNGSDYYLVNSLTNDPLSCGTDVEQISWQIEDPTGRALSSTALTKKPPKLKDFQSFFGLSISGSYFNGDFVAPYLIRAHVTSVKKG